MLTTETLLEITPEYISSLPEDGLGQLIADLTRLHPILEEDAARRQADLFQLQDSSDLEDPLLLESVPGDDLGPSQWLLLQNLGHPDRVLASQDTSDPPIFLPQPEQELWDRLTAPGSSLLAVWQRDETWLRIARAGGVCPPVWHTQLRCFEASIVSARSSLRFSIGSCLLNLSRNEQQNRFIREAQVELEKQENYYRNALVYARHKKEREKYRKAIQTARQRCVRMLESMQANSSNLPLPAQLEQERFDLRFLETLPPLPSPEAAAADTRNQEVLPCQENH